MASGTFRTPVSYAAGDGYSRYIYVNWESKNNPKTNSSTISWKAYVGSDDYSETTYVYGGPTIITINGAKVLNAKRQKLFKGMLLGSGTIIVNHDSDGTKSISVGIETAIFYSDTNNTVQEIIALPSNPVPTYNLSITAGDGSAISVTRTYCAGAGDIGQLSKGNGILCPGDILKIEFSAEVGHILTSAKVNEREFTSGNTITVNGNITIISTAQAASSSVSATDANIGSISTLTIISNSSSYYHSLQYIFGKESGYITSNGKTSASEVKFNNTSIAFSIPESFYAQIPNERSGVCTITCRTYQSASSNQTLGIAHMCTMNITILANTTVYPDLSTKIVDINPTTVTLTGDSSKLIRYRSNASCEATATPKKSAKIKSMTVNTMSMTCEVSGDATIGTKTIMQTDANSYLFTTTDTRGFVSLVPHSVSIIPYIPLTCNPQCIRPSQTSNEILLMADGNFYNGSFGACKNELTLKYRYKDTDESEFSDWISIDAGISYNAGGYYTTNAICLGDCFNYAKSYIIQISASDGNDGHTLTSIVKNVVVHRGRPVLDWGEHDFTVNVPININAECDEPIPISINNDNILDLLYPPGSVYLSMHDYPPDFLKQHWNGYVTMSIGNGIYAFYTT